MTASEWADRLSPKWADSLVSAVSTTNWNCPMSHWEVFETLANYEGGLTAHEVRDLIKDLYEMDLMEVKK